MAPKQPSSDASPKSTRSRTGCLTCRSRKIKCDEEFANGTCKNCARLKRECRQGSSITFRNEQNPSFSRQQANRLQGFYAYRNTFNPATRWVKIPKEVTFVAVDPTKIRGAEGEEYMPEDLGQPYNQHGDLFDLEYYDSQARNLDAFHDAQLRDAQARSIDALQTLSEAAIAGQHQSSSFPETSPYDHSELLAQGPNLGTEQQADGPMEHGDTSEGLNAEQIAYANQSLDYILKNAAEAAQTQIDPDLERLAAGAALMDGKQSMDEAELQQLLLRTEPDPSGDQTG